MKLAAGELKQGRAATATVLELCDVGKSGIRFRHPIIDAGAGTGNCVVAQLRNYAISIDRGGHVEVLRILKM